MRTVEGYDVKIFTDNVEETALSQIRELLSIDVFATSKEHIVSNTSTTCNYAKWAILSS